MVSILHPSFGRPDLARKCYDEWMGKADKPEDIEYILCLSNRDNTEAYFKEFATTALNKTSVTILLLNDKGLVKQVNHAATFAKGNLLIAVSDDFGCPEHWDTQLTNALQGKSDYIVKTIDGLQPFIITLPIMDRVYYERFGYVYHPSYNHLYGDEELAHVGKMLGRTISLPLFFEHRHYSTGHMKRDAVNVANDSNYQIDGRIFEHRKQNGFPK